MSQKPTIAILSIGQMGLGIATLLLAHHYPVITNISNRSAATRARAESAGISLVDTDVELAARADYVLSIVPPRDAVATAQRIIDALEESSSAEKEGEKRQIYYLDLNAIAPSTAKSIATSFTSHTPHLRFIDGGVIGGPPALNASTSTWTLPGIPLSGPHSLHKNDPDLAAVLNTKDVGPAIGTASGLKCCFAALSKGFAALAIQSYTTASSLDVLDPLKEYLDTYTPAVRQRAENSIVGCTGKAYRWVEEMNQIGACFASEGGFGEDAQVFGQVAGVFEGLAGVVERRGTEEMGSVEGVVGVLGEELRKERRSGS